LNSCEERNPRGPTGTCVHDGALACGKPANGWSVKGGREVGITSGDCECWLRQEAYVCVWQDRARDEEQASHRVRPGAVGA
jgi:hypothetical protein